MELTTTSDQHAVDLSSVAELVVQRFAAAPGAVVGAALRRGDASAQDGWHFGWGRAGVMWHPAHPPTLAADRSRPPAMTESCLFDLASVTKPVTALVLARGHRAGWIDRRAPLATLLPELSDTAGGRESLDELTAHRAGLEAHIEMFVKDAQARQADRATILARAARARRADCSAVRPAEGYPPIYSDLGYILVGAALERAGGLPLDELVRREVAAPLGLILGSARQLAADERAAERFVPTEDVAWRGGVLRGVVHDENAWVLAGGGSAGHAGLFGDVWSLVKLATAVADALAGRASHWLASADVAPLVERRPGGTHAAGFDRRGGDAPSSGARFGPETFGHLGFTGTSLWIDPERDLVGVLLTNRVHPTREHLAIREARPAAYDAIFEAMTR